MSTPTDFAAAAQALAKSLMSAAVNPSDALRLLTSLADFTPVPASSSAPIGLAIANAQNVTGDLFRRAAVVALARASATYQPTSADDAAQVRDAVCAALDKEISIAGDQGLDSTFNALRAVRAAVSQDLSTRGEQLATINIVSSALPLPAPVWAQRLYKDPTRSDELATEAGPPHPAFMPVSFRALSK